MGGAPLAPADLYVRRDGSDACDGSVDAAGQPPIEQGGACAFRTIAHAQSVAGCGEIVQIGPGSFGEDRIVIDDACAGADAKVFRGVGTDTVWMAGLVDVDDGACVRLSDAYDCPLPAAALDINSVASGDRPKRCLLQRDAGTVYFEDENGVKGDLDGALCVTWNDGALAAVEAHPGGAAAVDGRLLVRPWNDIEPALGDLWAPRGCASSSLAAIHIEGSGIVLSRMRVMSGCAQAIMMAGADNRLEQVDVWTGMVWIAASSQGAALEDVSIFNNYRRPTNQTATVGGEAWNTFSQSLAVQGGGFVIEDIDTFGSREGAGFSGGAHDGVVNGARFHGHHNHGFKVQDSDTGNILFRDVLSYNAQESLFIECPHDIRFESSTFPQGRIVVQGNPGGCTPARLSFHNNLLCGITWFAHGGDTWAEPGGHALDHNQYLTGEPGCGSTFRVRHIPSDTNFTLAEWQSWPADPCGDCVRDPSSSTATVSETWLRWTFKDDTAAGTPDFQLRAGAPAIDAGHPDFADGRDVAGHPRDGSPDLGAFER